MFGRLRVPVSPAACHHSSSCVARQNHRLIKATAAGVLSFPRDSEGQRNGASSHFRPRSKQRLVSRSCLFAFSSWQDKHLFVHIGPSNPGYNDPVLESIDVRQIYDKFSEKKGGLKELYEKGPDNAFFLVKFWVSAHIQSKHL